MYRPGSYDLLNSAAGSVNPGMGLGSFPRAPQGLFAGRGWLGIPENIEFYKKYPNPNVPIPQPQYEAQGAMPQAPAPRQGVTQTPAQPAPVNVSQGAAQPVQSVAPTGVQPLEEFNVDSLAAQMRKRRELQQAIAQAIAEKQQRFMV